MSAEGWRYIALNQKSQKKTQQGLKKGKLLKKESKKGKKNKKKENVTQNSLLKKELKQVILPNKKCSIKWVYLKTLPLVTWVSQSRLAFGHSAHKLVIGPPALAKPNPTVCSLACHWRLWSALRADQESFSILWESLFDSKALCQQLRVVVQQCCNKYFIS